MPETKSPRRPLAGLLTAQFFGAFNDNAMKLMVALLLGDVATRALSDSASEMARQEQTTLAFVIFTLPLVLFSLPSALLADRFSKSRIAIVTKTPRISCWDVHRAFDFPPKCCAIKPCASVASSIPKWAAPRLESRP